VTVASVHRVLHVAATYGITSETFVVDAVTAAEDAGWEAWVATLRTENRDRFPRPPDERMIVAPRFSLARRALDRLLKRSVEKRFANTVIDRLAAVRPTLVHAHFGWAGLYAVPIARRLQLPLVCTFHATDVTVYPKRPSAPDGESPTYRPLFATLTHALAVSAFTADTLSGLGWRGPTEIVPAGVSLERFPRRATAPADAPLRVLFVGRLVRRKGLDVLLHAMASLAQRRADLILEVIGDGDERAELARLTTRLGLDRAVRFRGSQGSAEIADALANAHVLVMPSRALPSGEVEGSPVILKEALAVGVPVVATRTGGTAEVLPPEYRHELVAPDDVGGLAAGIEAVLADRASWDERASVGRGWVEAQFDWAVLGRRTADLYSQLSAVSTSA
jgi:glycosyltransferase involved in cell wall biosynthesis